jgi:hypothetical protein
LRHICFKEAKLPFGSLASKYNCNNPIIPHNKKTKNSGWGLKSIQKQLSKKASNKHKHPPISFIL